MIKNSTAIKIHDRVPENYKLYLKKSLRNFFKELRLFCDKNDVNDFHEWLSERSYLSLFLNSQIRNRLTLDFTALQEYLVKKLISGGVGRCDGFFKVNDDVVLVESKLQQFDRKIRSSHWDIKVWENYDTAEIYSQLNNYYCSEKGFFSSMNRYKNVLLQTIVFKIIETDPSEHLHAANGNLYCKGESFSNRDWYYACHFPNYPEHMNIGIEVYGSLKVLSCSSQEQEH